MGSAPKLTILDRYDALIYTRALSGRSPGIASLHLVEGADHNFTGRQDEVVAVVTEWLECRNQGRLTPGVWMSDSLRSRL